MICPLNHAFPKIDENITNKYTNKYFTANGKASLIEEFTPTAYNNENKVFNYMKSNTAVMNNYSDYRPNKEYYNENTGKLPLVEDYSNYPGLNDISQDENCKYEKCPYCTNIITIRSPRTDLQDIVIWAGLTYIIYNLIK